MFPEGYGKGTGQGLYFKKIWNEYGWTINENGKHGKGANLLSKPLKNNNKNQPYQNGNNRTMLTKTLFLKNRN